MEAQNDIGSVLVSSLAKIPGVVVKRKPASANFTVKKEFVRFHPRRWGCLEASSRNRQAARRSGCGFDAAGDHSAT